MISANVLEALNLGASEPRDRIGGVGGLVDSVDVRTQIRLTRDDGQNWTNVSSKMPDLPEWAWIKEIYASPHAGGTAVPVYVPLANGESVSFSGQSDE